jgi:hypothetical protein
MTAVAFPRLVAWPSLLLACACIEPSFVSLGRNDEAVVVLDSAQTPEAGVLAPEAGANAAVGSNVECASGPGSSLVAAACASRQALGCPSVSGGDQTQLDQLLSDLMLECDATRNVVKARFEAGCATRFELADNTAPGAMELRACIAQRFAGERYSCAERLECGTGAVFRVPASSVEPDWH